MAKVAKKKPTKKPVVKITRPIKSKAVQPQNVSKETKTATITATRKTAFGGTVAADQGGNTTQYPLYDGVELPERTRNGGVPCYPLGMAEGQAFFVSSQIDGGVYTDDSEEAKAQREESSRINNRLCGAVRRYVKRNPDKKFSVCTVKNGKTLGFPNDNGIVVKRMK